MTSNKLQNFQIKNRKIPLERIARRYIPTYI